MKKHPKKQTTKEIFVNTRFEGQHCWPAAPDRVAFLRSVHRHIFGVKVVVGVTHDDRDVEFFMLKEEVDEFIRKSVIPHLRKVQTLSCEMMAEMIFDRLSSRDYNVKSITVDEDGQNGATVSLLTL